MQDTWISKYAIVYEGTEQEQIITTGVRKILMIDDKNSSLKNFSFNFQANENRTTKSSYQLTKKQVLISYEGQTDTSFYKVSPKNLVISADKEQSFKVIYERLEYYNQAKNLERLKKLLTTFTFERRRDSTRVEFKENAKVVVPDFKKTIGDNKDWMLDKHESELFLVVDGFSGFLLHVKEITPDGFSGIQYGTENKEVKFKKLPNKKHFNIAHFKGEWKEDREQEIHTLRKSHSNEILIVTDSVLHKHSKFISPTIDTLHWATNRENDMILLENKNLLFETEQWKILKLTEEDLVIERISKMITMEYDPIEILRYKKQ